MKKQVLLFAFLFLSAAIWAQNKSNLVIFSEDLEPFYAYVNGVKQNNDPETNVRFTGLGPNISLRIEFTNKALPVIKQAMVLQAGFEHTARLKYDKNKQMKLRYFGQVPMDQVVSDNGASTVAYHTADNSSNAGTTTTVIADNSNTMPVMNVATSTVTTNGTGQNASVNIGMPGGAGISVNVNDPTGQMTTQSTTMSTTTTDGERVQTRARQHQEMHHVNSETQNNTPPAPSAVTVTKSGCSMAMNSDAFNKMKASIDSKPFSETRMSTARVATKNACLSVDQIKEITKLFSMDEDKLAYAKFAYDYCVDKTNYYQVSDVFSFSGTTEDFNKFLEK